MNQQPAVGPSSERLQTALVYQHPVVGPSSERLQTALVYQQPVVGPSSERLQTALVYQQPVVGPSSERLQTALVRKEEPVAGGIAKGSGATRRKRRPASPSHPSQEALATALLQADKMKNDCGELCDTDRPLRPGQFFGTATAHVNCAALMANTQIDAQRDMLWCAVPAGRLRDYFTMNGKMDFVYARKCKDAPFLGHEAQTPVWTKEHIDNWIVKAKNRTLEGTYKIGQCNALIDAINISEGIVGGRVLVIGSAQPWVEAILLAAGTREVVTLEYGKIKSQHPQIKTLTPPELQARYANGSLGVFDAIVSYSSLEHAGLARYGDAINPWGDILAVARAWCVTEDGGNFVIGVPFGSDTIIFNWHRRYNGTRYPYLMANWEQVWRDPRGGHQRIHIFKKMPTAP